MKLRERIAIFQGSDAAGCKLAAIYFALVQLDKLIRDKFPDPIDRGDNYDECVGKLSTDISKAHHGAYENIAESMHDNDFEYFLDCIGISEESYKFFYDEVSKLAKPFGFGLTLEDA